MSLDKIKLRSIGLRPDPDRAWMVSWMVSRMVEGGGSPVYGPLLPDEVLSLGRHGIATALRVWHVLRPQEIMSFVEVEPELKKLISGEKRQGHPRALCSASVLLQLRSQVTLHGQSLDLSSNGMLMTIDRGSLSVGSGLNLTASSEEFLAPFTTRGRVARIASEGIYGIEFLEPSADAQNVINQFLIAAAKLEAA